VDLLAAWLLFPLLACLLFLGWGLIVERVSGRELPGVLLLPVGLVAVLAVCRALVVSTVAVDVALPFLALVAVIGLVLSRARLRAMRFDPWAAAAAAGVVFVIAAPAIFSGEPTFTGSLVLGDTAHQLTLADRLGDAGTQSPPPDSSYALSVRKYFVSAYPIGPQATLGIISPLGLLDLAWLYLPFLAMMVAATALSLNSLIARAIESRRMRALVTFVAAQPALVVAFALQGSIKEMTALATVTLTFALVLLVIVERWPARAFVAPTLAALATVGALGPPGLAYVAPPLAIAAGAWALRQRKVPVKRELLAAGAVVLAAVLLALPVLSGAGTAVKANDKTLSTGNQLGNLARPLDPLQASGAWVTGDYRYEPTHPHVIEGIAVIGCLAGLLGLIMAVRRRAVGPLLLTCVLLPISGFLLLRGNPYADAKVLVLASIVVPLLAMSGAAWLLTGDDRRYRILGAAVAAFVGIAVLASNAAAYHEVLLAPYHRYEEQRSIADQLEGKGPILFAEYDEFAKHFMRNSEILSQPEWPFEYPKGRLNVRAAAAHVKKNLDGLHPSFKSPLDPDGITPLSLEAARFIVIRRSPTTSRPPASYHLIRRGRYYEVWERDPRLRVVFHLPLGKSVFEPASRPDCREVERLAKKAERSPGGRLASVERRRPVLYDPDYASSHNQGFGFSERVPYQLYPRTVTVNGSGAAEAPFGVPKAGRYQAWIMGSFGRETKVSVDGRPAGSVSYEIANSGAYVALDQIELKAGPHKLVVSRGGGDLHPGNGGNYVSNLVNLGPTVVSPVEADRRTVSYTAPRDYRELCGRRLDWIEVVRPAKPKA
jgi:hypothetical protein